MKNESEIIFLKHVAKLFVSTKYISNNEISGHCGKLQMFVNNVTIFRNR